MQMETLRCQFPHTPVGMGMGGGVPITPPATPTSDISRTPTYSSLSSCSESDFDKHEYASTEFAPTLYSSQSSSSSSSSVDYSDNVLNSYSEDHSLSPPITPMSSPKNSTIHTIPEYSPLTTASPTISTSNIDNLNNNNNNIDNINNNNNNNIGENSTSASSSKKSSKNRNRKNSFVYDVRLTDEQFLFFVPDFDLVKSHLMFAVREEVEVLKEKISELMERISVLEYENSVLRQYATQEALQQLQQPHHSSNT